MKKGTEDPALINTAIFYSITSTQKGLQVRNVYVVVIFHDMGNLNLLFMSESNIIQKLLV